MGFSVQAVATSAGVSSAGLMNQFHSKDALVAAVVISWARSPDPELDRASALDYLAIVGDAGRTLPLTHALLLRLRRRRSATAGPESLDAFDRAALAAALEGA